MRPYVKAEAVKLFDDTTSDGSKPRVRFNWRSSREQPAHVPGLELVFDGFCSFAGGAAGLMDNAKFTKCCTDVGPGGSCPPRHYIAD